MLLHLCFGDCLELLFTLGLLRWSDQILIGHVVSQSIQIEGVIVPTVATAIVVIIESCCLLRLSLVLLSIETATGPSE